MVGYVSTLGRCVVVVAGDVVSRLAVRADDAGVSVDEFVDMLLRSQLWLLEGEGL